MDSSVVIAALESSDLFHPDAVLVFKELFHRRRKNKLKLIIPSIVFYETMVTLLKKGLERKVVERHLWKFLHLNNIFNVAVIETMAFRLTKNLDQISLANLRTYDFMIASIGLEFDAQILTFDLKMRKKIGQFYPSVYYCSSISSQNTFGDETPKFLQELDNRLTNVYGG